VKGQQSPAASGLVGNESLVPQQNLVKSEPVQPQEGVVSGVVLRVH